MVQKKQNQDLKVETKIPDNSLDFLLFFNIAVENFCKKINLVKLELSKQIFLGPEYIDFGSKF